jgi:predicted transglutaminase-like cysteine proteinase
LKWPVSFFLLLLAGALVIPSEFAAMGAAPGQGVEAGLTSETESRAADSEATTKEEVQGTEAEPRPEDAASATTVARQTGDAPPQDQDRLTQSTPQPVWHQGEQSATSEEARPSRAQSAPTPVWRQGATTRPETPAARVQGATGGGDGPIRLFQSAAFRGNFNALPKWKRVLSKVKGEIQTLNSCIAPKCPPGATSWQRIMKQARGQERMEQLRMVNSFFNKWPYRLDQDAYGVSDWWATPQEFLKISGDCEDYAIIKYFALRELGFSQDDLRIVVVKDRIRGIAHAVLAVFTQGDAYILNNVSDAIFTHDKYRHYVPQYSLNEEHRWSHIPVAN